MCIDLNWPGLLLYITEICLIFQPIVNASGAAEVPGRSAYGIVKPVPGKKGEHGAGGPFDTKKLLETMSKNREVKRKADAEKAKGAVGGSETLKGIGTIIARKNPEEKKGKLVDKFRKDVTIKPSPSKPTPALSDTQVSVSDVNLSLRSDNDFDQTLKDVQSKVATDAFNVMQLIVRTMTGIFPVSFFS